MPEATGVGGFKMPEEPKKGEKAQPMGKSDGFQLKAQKSSDGSGSMNQIEQKFVDAYGPEKGKKAYNRFINSFMITAVNQMHAASKAAIQREKQANRQANQG